MCRRVRAPQGVCACATPSRKRLICRLCLRFLLFLLNHGFEDEDGDEPDDKADANADADAKDDMEVNMGVPQAQAQ